MERERKGEESRDGRSAGGRGDLFADVVDQPSSNLIC